MDGVLVRVEGARGKDAAKLSARALLVQQPMKRGVGMGSGE